VALFSLIFFHSADAGTATDNSNSIRTTRITFSPFEYGKPAEHLTGRKAIWQPLYQSIGVGESWLLQNLGSGMATIHLRFNCLVPNSAGVRREHFARRAQFQISSCCCQGALMKYIFLQCLIAMILNVTCSTSVLADAKDDAARNLASRSGCFVCHAIEPGAPGLDGKLPVGPAWKAVAARYKGDASEARKLTTAVMGGTSPYIRHWKDETSGNAMPPNSVTLSEADAAKLVAWILGLR
jgi:cytochrome c